MVQGKKAFEAWLADIQNVTPHMPRHVVLGSALAKGGQGMVYSGYVNQEAAAIKIYFPGQQTTRIQREKKALANIDCPSIVKLLWSDRIMMNGEELNVVATNLVPGISLCEMLINSPLAETEIGVVLYDLAAAIDAMWERRIVHRDLKPSNVLIKPSGRACVIDLGVARHLDQTSLTQMGLTWGTLGYLSPEQTRGIRQLTCKSDIFAVGVVAVEAGLGHHPTRRNQLRLQARGLHKKLPARFANWHYASILADMLHPRPTMRPKPAEILSFLSQYTT